MAIVGVLPALQACELPFDSMCQFLVDCYDFAISITRNGCTVTVEFGSDDETCIDQSIIKKSKYITGSRRDLQGEIRIPSGRIL